MANRVFNRLTSKRVTNLLRDGIKAVHCDGDGLYLCIASPSAAHWERRFQLDGKARYHGLGSARVFSLAQARKRNITVSQQLADGVSPIEHKRNAKLMRVAAASASRTFEQVARSYYDAHAAGWSKGHAAQWATSVLGTTPSGRKPKDDVLKTLRKLPVASIDTPMVLAALQPSWSRTPVAAARVRERIESVITAAVANGFRQAGPNPASWDILQHLLASPGAAEHHAAMAFADVPALLVQLAQREDIAARALELVVLTATRASETLGATWAEIDLKAAVWKIPAPRMKRRVEHVVPLSAPAVAILRVAMSWPREDTSPDGLIFPGARPGKKMPTRALLRVLRSLGHPEITTHGFRSSFSTWAHQLPGAIPYVIEMSLAHKVGDDVAAAYNRGDLLKQRRTLLTAWGHHCVGASGDNVRALRG
jgi:integrase